MSDCVTFAYLLALTQVSRIMHPTKARATRQVCKVHVFQSIKYSEWLRVNGETSDNTTILRQVGVYRPI